MQRFAVLALLLGLAAVAQADPNVTLGTYTYTQGAPGTQAIQILVWQDTTTGNFTGIPSNSPNSQGVQGLDLNIRIAYPDGSDATGFGPKFVLGTGAQPYVGPASGANTGGDPISGTIFATTGEGGTHLSPASATHTPPSDGGGSSQQNLQIALNVSGGRATMSTNSSARSLLATIYIDVSTAGVGDWALEIGDPNGTAGPDNGPLDFSDGGTLNTALVDGIIRILPIPEPASIVLGLFAAAGLAVVAVRRRHRA